MRTVGKVALVSCAIAVACATRSTDSGPRLSAIEERLTRLEGLLAPDAGTLPLVQDAGLEATEPSYFSQLHPFDGGFNFDPARYVAECKRSVEERCAQELTQSRLAEERARRRGFGWIETGPTQTPDATAAGRACLERERASCERRGQREKVFEWLDAQLVPGKRDEKLTSEIRERVAKHLGAPADKVDVVCAPRFCRFGPGFTHLHFRVAVGDDFGSSLTEGNRYVYWMRRGFELSQ